MATLSEVFGKETTYNLLKVFQLQTIEHFARNGIWNYDWDYLDPSSEHKMTDDDYDPDQDSYDYWKKSGKYRYLDGYVLEKKSKTGWLITVRLALFSRIDDETIGKAAEIISYLLTNSISMNDDRFFEGLLADIIENVDGLKIDYLALRRTRPLAEKNGTDFSYLDVIYKCKISQAKK